MTKYHINPETGDVKPCSAKIRCAFSDAEGNEPPHYSTIEEAHSKNEENLREQYSTLPSKSSSKTFDELENEIYDSGHVKVKDAEEVRELPVTVIRINQIDETITSSLITRVSVDKDTLVRTFYDEDDKPVARYQWSDNIMISDKPLNEIVSDTENIKPLVHTSRLDLSFLNENKFKNVAALKTKKFDDLEDAIYNSAEVKIRDPDEVHKFLPATIININQIDESISSVKIYSSNYNKTNSTFEFFDKNNELAAHYRSSDNVMLSQVDLDKIIPSDS